MLAVLGLSAAGWVMYAGYVHFGTGWLLLGSPFALITGLFLQAAIQQAFPPKLEANAEGDTWLKLR